MLDQPCQKWGEVFAFGERSPLLVENIDGVADLFGSMLGGDEEAQTGGFLGYYGIKDGDFGNSMIEEGLG